MSSNAETGYIQEGFFNRFMLVASHLPFLLFAYIGWRIRDINPWVLVATISMYLASSAYHMCYSFGFCFFDDRRMHRHCDHNESLMWAVTLPTIYLFVRRRVCGDGLIENSRKLTAAEQTQVALSGGYYHERPRWLDPLILLLYIFNRYVHVHQGMNKYDSYASLYIMTGVVAVVSLIEVRNHGLRPNIVAIILVLVPLAIGYGLFLLDGQIGAVAHWMWHICGAIGAALYGFYGPFLVASDGRAVAITMSQKLCRCRCLGWRWGDEDDDDEESDSG